MPRRMPSPSRDAHETTSSDKAVAVGARDVVLRSDDINFVPRPVGVRVLHPSPSLCLATEASLLASVRVARRRQASLSQRQAPRMGTPARVELVSGLGTWSNPFVEDPAYSRVSRPFSDCTKRRAH